MEQMKQKNGSADLLDQKECLSCRIIYSIYSNFPPMPSAQAYNVETGEFFPFDRLRSLPNGYEMAKSRGIAWACNCRGRSRTPPQNLGNAQPFGYKPLDAPNGDVEQVAGSNGRPGNNQAQNKQTNDVARILRLTPDQSRLLHDELDREPPMGFHGIMERAKDMFNLW